MQSKQRKAVQDFLQILTNTQKPTLQQWDQEDYEKSKKWADICSQIIVNSKYNFEDLLTNFSNKIINNPVTVEELRNARLVLFQFIIQSSFLPKELLQFVFTDYLVFTQDDFGIDNFQTTLINKIKNEFEINYLLSINAKLRNINLKNEDNNKNNQISILKNNYFCSKETITKRAFARLLITKWKFHFENSTLEKLKLLINQYLAQDISILVNLLFSLKLKSNIYLSSSKETVAWQLLIILPLFEKENDSFEISEEISRSIVQFLSEKFDEYSADMKLQQTWMMNQWWFNFPSPFLNLLFSNIPELHAKYILPTSHFLSNLFKLVHDNPSASIVAIQSNTDLGK